MALTEVSWRPTIPSRPTKDITPSSSVRRCLFGPVDHEEVRRDLQREMRSMNEANTRRWNFDFERECPLEGRYLWYTNNVTPEAKSESKSILSNSLNGKERCLTTAPSLAKLGCVKTTTESASKTHRKKPTSNKITEFLRYKKPCTRSDRYTKCLRKQTRAKQICLDRFLK